MYIFIPYILDESQEEIGIRSWRCYNALNGDGGCFWVTDEFEIRREDLEILDHNSRQDKAAGEEIPANSDNGPDDGDELG